MDDLLAAIDWDTSFLSGFSGSPTCSVPPWPSFASGGEPDLACPSRSPLGVTITDPQSPLTATLALDPVYPTAANCADCASPSQNSRRFLPRTAPTSSEDAPSRTQTPKTPRRTHKRKRDSDASHDTAAEIMVACLSQNVLREDYYSLLETELPRWAREGLWPATGSLQQQHDLLNPGASSPNSTTASTPSPSSSSPSSSSSHAPSPAPCYSSLERAYQAVCQLDKRMSDDVLRNRIALIQLHLEYTRTHERRCQSASSTRGRGDASHIIDRILESTHREEWAELDQRRRADLRAKFHDQKRYGKRWAQLADALGPGILLVCATRLANAIKSTTVTAKMLQDVIERIKVSDPATVNIIAIVTPLAKCLLNNERFQQAEVVEVLRQLKS
ncbi:unnamed protein product [Discula destructiva]